MKLQYIPASSGGGIVYILTVLSVLVIAITLIGVCAEQCRKPRRWFGPWSRRRLRKWWRRWR